jgi:tagatose-1,6-bisphosphate aldolase non-catalytic subunit AgaZ/GatZ
LILNYDKKSRKPKGRQETSYVYEERQRYYYKGYTDGQSDLIQRLIAAGVLPAVDFDHSTMQKYEAKPDDKS